MDERTQVCGETGWDELVRKNLLTQVATIGDGKEGEGGGGQSEYGSQ